jgi:hypothetical protein
LGDLGRYEEKLCDVLGSNVRQLAYQLAWSVYWQPT